MYAVNWVTWFYLVVSHKQSFRKSEAWNWPAIQIHLAKLQQRYIRKTVEYRQTEARTIYATRIAYYSIQKLVNSGPVCKWCMKEKKQYLTRSWHVFVIFVVFALYTISSETNALFSQCKINNEKGATLHLFYHTHTHTHTNIWKEIKVPLQPIQKRIQTRILTI